MKRVAIISSSRDTAGVNIRENLIRLFGFEKTDEKFDSNEVFQLKLNDGDENEIIIVKLHLTNEELISSEGIDKKIDADILVFASKHRSKENTPSFAVHPIGNWGSAELGGKEKMLCLSSAILLKRLYIALVHNCGFFGKSGSFEVTLEATHHGPYVEKPAVFVEVGSTEKEWSDSSNGEIIAKTIMGAMKNYGAPDKNYKSCVVLGGGHYNQAANKLMLKTDYAVGHICPKYALEYLDEEMLLQSLKNTFPAAELAILDWKGMGQYKQKTIELLEKLNIKYGRYQKICKVEE